MPRGLMDGRVKPGHDGGETVHNRSPSHNLRLT